MENQKKGSKKLVVGVAAAVVVLAVVLVLVLSQCTGGIQTAAPSQTTTEATITAGGAPAYQLYWNLDRAEYDGRSEGGMSSREMEDDGLFHIRMFCDGQELILRTADRKVVNKIDKENLMGLVFNEDGLITEVLLLEDMPLKSWQICSMCRALVAI